MPLTPGARLGPYEIQSPLGAGGMGEVYKARDTRLERIVAVKILPEALASDPQFRERFDREARAISQLEHPHICALYDVGDENPSAGSGQAGISYLVMQYLEGDTLAARLANNLPLPTNDALTIAIQVASALDKAHRSGIVHRDLKPGNIMLTKAGAKLLDFGLAKSVETVGRGFSPAGGAGSKDPAYVQLSQAPTMAEQLTQQGTILGTLQYMAPEQIEGEESDARTDIFAFGAVLYEMLAGRKAFQGKSQASLIGAILKDTPPPIASLQPLTPLAIDRIVHTCLAKDPDERWQNARDLLRELTWIRDGAKEESVKAAAPEAARAPRSRSIVVIAATAVLAAALGGAAAWTLRPGASAANAAVVRVEVALPPGDSIGFAMDGPTLALSPDGTTLAYVGGHDNQQQLFVRPLSSLETKAIARTEGALSPFFSPDGQWVGFFAQGKLKKVAVAGGGVQVLADAPQPRGGTWAPDGTIYFAPISNSGGISRVSASGGAVTEVTTLDAAKGEITHRWPQILPGGRALLFSVRSGSGDGEWRIETLILQTGERRVLAPNADTGYYVSTGHLVYASNGSDVLMAVPMDLDRVEVATGAPVVLEEKVRLGGEGAHFAVSDAGHVAYVRGGEQRRSRRLVWVDRQGSVESMPVPTREYRSVALSPSNSMAAIETGGGANEIWIYDFIRRTMSKLDTDGRSQAPVWSPDGTRVAYRATRGGSRNISWKAVDNAGSEVRLTTDDQGDIPGSFSPDGQLLFARSNTSTATDLWVLPTVGAGAAPRRVLAADADQLAPQISPDGRWLAYASAESGRSEIYVQSFPAMDRKWLVSIDGGIEPRWSRGGRELFYRSGDRLMAVDVTAQPVFSAGSPHMLFQGHGVPTNTNSTGYDVSLDGQRFLMAEPVEAQAPVTQIEIVMNWFEELKRLVPVK